MTRLSESKTRSVAAIGNSRVIPTAFSPRESGEGIQWLSNARHWVPACAGTTVGKYG